jgi:hypothetical protein
MAVRKTGSVPIIGSTPIWKTRSPSPLVGPPADALCAPGAVEVGHVSRPGCQQSTGNLTNLRTLWRTTYRLHSGQLSRPAGGTALDGIAFDQTFTDKASGKDINRPQLELMLRFAGTGDTIVVHSMDRLARNLDDLRRIVHTLTGKGVRIEFVKEHLSFTGDDSPMASRHRQLNRPRAQRDTWTETDMPAAISSRQRR